MIREGASAGGRISLSSFGKCTQPAASPGAGGSSSTWGSVALQLCTLMSTLISESAEAFFAVHILKMLLFSADSSKIVLMRVLSGGGAQCPLICTGGNQEQLSRPEYNPSVRRVGEQAACVGANSQRVCPALVQFALKLGSARGLTRR